MNGMVALWRMRRTLVSCQRDKEMVDAVGAFAAAVRRLSTAGAYHNSLDDVLLIRLDEQSKGRLAVYRVEGADASNLLNAKRRGTTTTLSTVRFIYRTGIPVVTIERDADRIRFVNGKGRTCGPEQTTSRWQRVTDFAAGIATGASVATVDELRQVVEQIAFVHRHDLEQA